MAKRRTRVARRSSSRSSDSQAEPLDDIALLNAHRYPESAPATVLAQLRNNREYQRRLEELVKGVPGRRSGSQGGWNQLMQEKLDESRDDPAEPGDATSPPGEAPPSANTEQEEPGMGERVASFVRKLIS